MRILYASERPPYPFFLGGAARCAHHLMAAMTEQGGAECMAVGSADYAHTAWSYPLPEEFDALGVHAVVAPRTDTADNVGESVGSVDCGYPVEVVTNFPVALGRMIDRFNPDLVWAQLEGARQVLAIAQGKGVRGLLYVHDAEFDPIELRAAAALGCHIVCSSAFLARKTSRVLGQPVHVVYPASDWYFGTQGDANGLVTMINPYPVKGIDTFLEIARRMPQLQFLLVESWKLSSDALAALQSRLRELPNVRLQHRVSDMREIYGQTRLLLVPSMWEEGFGMVAVEAQSCGIPVIASERGGLPESVGDGGMLIRDFRNVKAWIHAIGAVLDDDSAYRNWSAGALAHARSADFDRQELARRFLAVCSLPAPRTTVALRLGVVLDGLERAPMIGKLLREVRR